MDWRGGTSISTARSVAREGDRCGAAPPAGRAAASSGGQKVATGPNRFGLRWAAQPTGQAFKPVAACPSKQRPSLVQSGDAFSVT